MKKLCKNLPAKQEKPPPKKGGYYFLEYSKNSDFFCKNIFRTKKFKMGFYKF